MASEKVAKILRAKTNLSEEQISGMADGEAWALIYRGRPRKSKKRRDLLGEICFTGFSPSARAELEKQAENSRLEIVKSVTKNLSYLCVGPNAGLEKLKKATAQGVQIVTQDEFQNMIKTGEIPTSRTA